MPKRSAQTQRGAPAIEARSESWLRLLGVALICAKVALVPVLFDPSSDVPFVVMKGLVSHALAYALVGVLVGLVIQSGWSVFGRSWLHLLVLSFLAANIAATVFAVDGLLALYGEHGRMVGLATVADCVVLYFAIVALVRTRGEAIAVVASGLVGSTVVLAYEFTQLAGRDPFNWAVDSALRPFSTIGQTTNLAEYLTVVAVGAAAYGLFDRALRRELRILLLLYSGVALAGVIVTQTRSAFLGLIGGAGVLLLLTWLGYPSRRARLISLAGAGVVTVALGLLLLLTPLGSRLLTTVEIPSTAGADDSSADPRLEQSADVRLSLYRIALEMVRERPLLGYGPDTFAVGLPKYRSESEPFEVQQGVTTSAHSWVAQTAAGAGLVGLVLFCSIALAGMVLTLERGFHPSAWAGAGMIAAFLGAGLTTVNAISTDWVFWASAGAIGATVTSFPTHVANTSRASVRRQQRAPARQKWTTRSVASLGCAAFGLLLALTVAGGLNASQLAQTSRQMRLAGRAAEAVDLGVRATRLDAQRAEYWRVLGLAYLANDKQKDAATAFEQATKLRPYDVRPLGDFARTLVLLARSGDASAASRAREAGDLAVRLDPNNPDAHITRAVVMQGTGNLPEALVSITRALELEPISTGAEMYRTAAQILLAVGKTDDAIAMARRGVAALASQADKAHIRVELARALAASGQHAQALAEIDAALAVVPNDSDALQLRAKIRAAMGLS